MVTSTGILISRSSRGSSAAIPTDDAESHQLGGQ
jgi:hypothetical protein